MRGIKPAQLPLAQRVIGGSVLSLLAAAVWMIFRVAPTEATMGDVQRILYLHISVAWCGLAGSVAMGVFGVVYLARRRLAWDHWSQAGAEVGWLCVTLTLITGSMWAHEAWGVWWTWEPRLTSSLVLWFILAGIFLLRAGIDDPHRRARVGAVLAVLALGDLPLVVMATRWFRGVHPVSPEMDPGMRLVVLVAVAGFTAFFASLTWQRRGQLGLAERVAALESHAEVA